MAAVGASMSQFASAFSQQMAEANELRLLQFLSPVKQKHLAEKMCERKVKEKNTITAPAESIDSPITFEFDYGHVGLTQTDEPVNEAAIY